MGRQPAARLLFSAALTVPRPLGPLSLTEPAQRTGLPPPRRHEPRRTAGRLRSRSAANRVDGRGWTVPTAGPVAREGGIRSLSGGAVTPPSRPRLQAVAHSSLASAVVRLSRTSPPSTLATESTWMKWWCPSAAGSVLVSLRRWPSDVIDGAHVAAVGPDNGHVLFDAGDIDHRAASVRCGDQRQPGWGVPARGAAKWRPCGPSWWSSGLPFGGSPDDHLGWSGIDGDASASWTVGMMRFSDDSLEGRIIRHPTDRSAIPAGSWRWPRHRSRDAEFGFAHAPRGFMIRMSKYDCRN